MSKKLFFHYNKEIQKKDEDKPKYYKQSFSKHSRNQMIENDYDQDFKGIKQTNFVSKEIKANLEPKKSEKTLNDNNFNTTLLNKFENLENQIKDVKSEIKSLGEIFQKSLENLSKLIIELIKGKTQIKQDDKNILNKKKEKFDSENNKLIYYTFSEKRKSKYDKSERILPKRKLFTNSNSSENDKDQVKNNGSANFSFSFENGSKKENSQEASSKNENKEVENSIRRKYERLNKK